MNKCPCNEWILTLMCQALGQHVWHLVQLCQRVPSRCLSLDHRQSEIETPLHFSCYYYYFSHNATSMCYFITLSLTVNESLQRLLSGVRWRGPEKKILQPLITHHFPSLFFTLWPDYLQMSIEKFESLSSSNLTSDFLLPQSKPQIPWHLRLVEGLKTCK